MTVLRLASRAPVLLPSFLLRDTVMAWECSVCRKLFSITAEEAEGRQGLLPPEEVRHEFHMHDCALTFYSNAVRTEQIPS